MTKSKSPEARFHGVDKLAGRGSARVTGDPRRPFFDEDLPPASPAQLEHVLAWIPTAPIADLQRAAEAIKAHAAELGRQLDESAVQ